MKYILRSFFTLVCLLNLNACSTTHSLNNYPLKEPSKKYLNALHPRVVLVLGSGSARGFAHAGVIKVLEENHIPIDLIVGTSTGSIVGALYADQPSAAHLQKLLLTTKRDEVINISYSHPFSGIFKGTALQNFLQRNMHTQNFENLKIPLIAVATDMDANQIHLFASGPIAPAVNASSAVSPFFKPVYLYGKTYIDGGYIDPVAVDVAKRFHPKLIIAVSLKYPLPTTTPTNSLGILLRTYNIMQLKLSEYSAKGADVIIEPEIGEIEMFNGDRSENGDYIYGKRRLREIDRRVRYLTKRLENAIVVDPELQKNLNQVFFWGDSYLCSKR